MVRSDLGMSMMLSSVLSLAACGGSGGTGTSVKYPIVLVHGAWMGAWAWNDVAASLKAQGATVTAVELPAHGADRTPVAGVTLDSYVSKVSAAVDAAGSPVMLVGHSMGGVVISQVAEQKPVQIARLVYLGAVLPQDGQSLQTATAMDSDSHLGGALTFDMTNGTAAIAPDKLQDVFCADCAAVAIQNLKAQYRDEPLGPLATPVHTTPANWGKAVKYYVYTKQDHAISYAQQQRMTAGVTLAATATLDTSHSPFLSSPASVVQALLGFDE